MTNRFKLALQSQSACNVSGLAHSVVEMCREVRAEGGAIEDDPAIALVVYQMAYLCKVDDIHMTAERYAELTIACEEKEAA